MQELVTAMELARRLGVTVATVRTWERRGWIACLRDGQGPVLFDLREVQKALRKRGGVNAPARAIADLAASMLAVREARHRLHSEFGIDFRSATQLEQRKEARHDR